MLKEHDDGSITIGKNRVLVCLESAWEMDAIADMLVTIGTNGTPEETNVGYKARCIASRIKELSSILMSGMSDGAEVTRDLERRVNLTI